MKKYVAFGAVLILSGAILMACSDDDNNNNVDKNGNIEENSSQNNNDAPNDINNFNDNDNMDDNNHSGSSGVFEPEAEDQEGLGIGDTGTFDTSLGSYEMTLDSAKLVGPELDGEQTTKDDLVLLDITIKNTSDDALQIEDLTESMNVTEDTEKSGSSDGAEYFDSVEEFSGELEPNEERSGQFIADVNTSETYYFLKDAGNIGGGSSNQVIWEFEAEEE